MDKKTTFQDLYSWPGVRACARVRVHPSDPLVWLVTLMRRQKKAFVPVAQRLYGESARGERMLFVIWMRLKLRFILNLNTAGLIARTAKL